MVGPNVLKVKFGLKIDQVTNQTWIEMGSESINKMVYEQVH